MPRRKVLSDEVVLDGALKVMFRQGPADFTLARVAAETGIAPATLLQRFGDKHGLIVAAVTRDNAAFERTLANLPVGRGAAAVIAVFRLLTPGVVEPESFADQLLWLHQDMRDPQLNALARARFDALRAAVALRMPPLRLAPEAAARLAEAQWQGAMNQWELSREGTLADYVTRSLAAWFTLAGGR